MKRGNSNNNDFLCKKIFQYPGSTIHNPPLLCFTIDHMLLKIHPDLSNSILSNCEQILKITAIQDLREIILNVAELKIYKISSSSINIINFQIIQKEDKLVITLEETLRKGKTIEITITYSAGYYYVNGSFSINKPRSGFHFISSKLAKNESQAKQTWTQGQATESRYWFPCLDHPNVKFPINLQIISQIDHRVISNGKLISKKIGDNNTIIWDWEEKNPIPAYLVSVVIGKFAEIESKFDTIPLNYYWPTEIPKEDAILTFSETPQILEFFENYFDIKYPYEKYAQVAVDEFEFGGMENNSCTTLTRNILHDKKTAIDYNRDILIISHEIAHQWLGNLVTCNEWSHIWLNEGFATYCELLYWEKSRGTNEFYLTLLKYADKYFEEVDKFYKRPIVTEVYKHPDELFDAHSYEKGGCILHMIRNYIGDDSFKKCLKSYIEKYREKTVETDNFQKIIEEISGKSMHTFFDQWVYRKGHPELDIEISQQENDNENNNENRFIQLKVKIIQSQELDDISDTTRLFDFPLEVRLISSNNKGEIDEQINTILINKKITEHIFDVKKNSKIEWISIDPQFKILKKVKSIKVIDETKEIQIKDLLKSQLHNGKTIIERIEASRLLKNFYSEDIVCALQNAITNDNFYGVSSEAANTIGSFFDKNNFKKSNTSYQILTTILCNNELFNKLHSDTRKSIIKNIGEFEREESINLLESFINEENDFVKSTAATAIGKSSKNLSSEIKIKKILPLLMKLVNSDNTFQNIVATGAINGLKELSKDNSINIFTDISEFLVKNTESDNKYFIRLTATSALGKFLYKENKNKNSKDINQKVFDQLLKLLKDKRRKIKINACTALVDDDAKFTTKIEPKIIDAINTLINVAQYDVDGFVRRHAETSINKIRGWINEWSAKPQELDIKIREMMNKTEGNN
jgi:aminopeptidase N